MTEIEYLFCINLQKKLKEKIIGKIFVKIDEEDKLIVSIQLDKENIRYVFKYDTITSKLLSGWSTNDASIEIIEKYEKFILNKFFKRHVN